MADLITIAVRTYPLDDDYIARDIVLRDPADNSLSIRYTTNGCPGEPDWQAPMSVQRFFEWREELPEQIELGAYSR
ncbi:hypothetical protein ONR75_18495 [Rhodopseudomonas sp. P2A-2r]|uniref:hypothetical protein n=1 Tax=Rhodopseudomonas sp. P2A-2r TaxID=2991972 RepID=UPI002234C155|nr:hypothetical protein [Rhodopseudomonas sp. P2A-2r]UZE46995.1 hypothetical protein ONR75_18495 [Rhodopseudomonas sp. P2A-2r]